MDRDPQRPTCRLNRFNRFDLSSRKNVSFYQTMTLASFAYNRLVDGSVRWLIPSIVKYLPYSVTECRGQSSNRLCCSDNLDDPLGTGCKVRNRGGERVGSPLVYQAPLPLRILSRPSRRNPLLTSSVRMEWQSQQCWSTTGRIRFSKKSMPSSSVALG